jgi:hypothetical protein
MCNKDKAKTNSDKGVVHHEIGKDGGPAYSSWNKRSREGIREEAIQKVTEDLNRIKGDLSE